MTDLDPITRALSTDYFVSQASESATTCNEAGKHFGLVLFQVDRLTALADEYGTEIRDSVIREFGSTLLGATREKDMVGRYSDHIFAVALFDASSEHTAFLAERLAELARVDILYAGGEEIRYSVNVGWSSTEHQDSEINFEQIRAQSEAALEKAINLGPGAIVGHGMEQG